MYELFAKVVWGPIVRPVSPSVVQPMRILLKPARRRNDSQTLLPSIHPPSTPNRHLLASHVLRPCAPALSRILLSLGIHPPRTTIQVLLDRLCRPPAVLARVSVNDDPTPAALLQRTQAIDSSTA